MTNRSALLGSIIVPDLANPRPEDVDIAFMQYRMETIVRFNGHPAALNLAEHQSLCGLLAEAARADDAVIRWATLHDCHEYATGDLTTPLKRSIDPRRLGEVQQRWDDAICDALGIPRPAGEVIAEVATFDMIALGLEWRFALGRDVAELGLPSDVVADVRFLDRRLFDKAVTEVRREEIKFGRDTLAMG